MAGYVDAVPAFVCFELPAREASSFCDFFEIDLLQFHRIYLLFDWSKRFLMCLLRINLPNLFPNMIRVMLLISVSDTLKKWCFFWRTVYINLGQVQGTNLFD